MTRKHIDETMMVDYVLGNLASEEEDLVKEHISSCSTCAKEYYSWQHLLDRPKGINPTPGLKRRIDEGLESGLKRRVNEEVERRKKVRFYRRDVRKKQIFVYASIAAFILLTIGLVNMTNPSSSTNSVQPEYIMAQHEQVPETAFVEGREANQLNTLPVTSRNDVRGEIWLNDKTNELFLRVDGLAPLETNDYQLWIVHSDDVWNGELLHLRNGSVRVYYRGNDINLLKYMKVSVEPQGGSLEPTGPETLSVDLNEN